MRLIDKEDLMRTLGITSEDCYECDWGENGYCTRGSDFTDACDAICTALLVEPQNWIPCSERLPDEDVEVLVTDDAGGVANLELDKVLRYEESGELFWLTSQNVTAWMPVPEPYKEGEQDG